MNNFLNDLALAHQRHEGFYPGSKAYRNNNPGNIRGKNGAFIVYPTYAEGFAALKYDLSAKIFGTAGTVKRYMAGTGKKYEELVFLEYVAIYAPTADNNSPTAYTDSLCKTLSQYNVRPGTPLMILAQLIRGQIDRVTDVPPPIQPEKRLAMAENALRWASPERASMLRRLIERLKKLLGVQ